jgi:hypothetical protein
MLCKHHIVGNFCEAYRVIPDVIMSGEHDHTKPYDGDGGIRFEPMTSSDLPDYEMEYE